MKLEATRFGRLALAALRARRPAGWGSVLALSLLWLAGGCSTKHYQKSADREAYNLVGRGQKQVLGHTNAFSIDTPYSTRDPQTIKPPELIEDRLRTGSPRVLTIEQALELAATSSRRFQAQKEQLYLLALSVSGARHKFIPNPLATSVASRTRYPDEDTLGEVKSQVAVSQMLKTGGQIGVGLANDVLRWYTGSSPGSAISTLSAYFSQPLLRGFGRYNLDVENLTQAERNLIYGVRNYTFFQNTFAVEVLNDYFNLLAQKDVLRNQYTNYLSRISSTRRLEARAADRERLTDVDQARQAELSAKVSYVNTATAYLSAMDQFKIKLGLTVGEPIRLDDQPLDELQARGPVAIGLPREEAYRLAVRRHMDILNEIDKFEDSQRKILVYANQLKADLNVFGNSQLSSSPPTDYAKFNADRVQAQVGVQLNLPLDRLLERNNYRSTLVSFESELRNLTLRLDTLKDAIERGLRTVEQRRQNYEIQTNALTLANRRVDSVTLLLEAGRAEVRDLVDAQDAKIAAQNAVTSELVAYQQAALQLLLDIGVLETESRRFWLKDQLAGVFQRPPDHRSVGPDGLIPPDQILGESP